MEAYYLKAEHLVNSKGSYLLYFVVRSWDKEIINEGFNSYREAKKRVNELNKEHLKTFGVKD